MKTFDLKSLLLGVVLTMAIVIVMLLVTSNNAPISWDYKVVQGSIVNSTYENRLNAAAKDGWEVVGVATDNEHNITFAVMRRAKAVPRPAWWIFWKR